MSRFLHWCSFSAFGHVVLFEVAIAAPLMVLASIALQLAGLASAATLATTALVLAVGSAAIGLLTWLAITRPMLRKK